MPTLRKNVLVVSALLPAACSPAESALEADEDTVIQTANHDFRVVEVADGLVRPFSMTFTPEEVKTRKGPAT